jgi:ABC-2 type transport system permease protein
MLDKPLAILVRDAQLALSYPLWFALQWAGIAASATSLFFVSKIVPQSGSFSFNGTPGSYFDFALVNVAFLTFQTTALASFDSAIRDDQMRGTLEATYVTPTAVGTIVLSSGLWAFAITLVNVLCYLAIGALFGLHLRHLNVPAAIVLVLLTITATVPIGILSAAGVMVFKQGAPVQFVFIIAASLSTARRSLNCHRTCCGSRCSRCCSSRSHCGSSAWRWTALNATEPSPTTSRLKAISNECPERRACTWRPG